MRRLSITIDDALVREAQETLGTHTKAETIRLALEEIVRRRRLKEVLDHQGQMDLQLDRATLAKLRAES